MPVDDEVTPVTTMNAARRRRAVTAPEPEKVEPDEPDVETPKARTRVKAGATNGAAKVPDDDEGIDVPKIRGGWSEGQQVMDSASSFAQAFKPDEKTVFVKFLSDSPYANYKRHWVERRSAAGQKVNRPYVCLETVGRSCPLCDDLGDRPQAVSSFNIALIGDDGQLYLKSWDVGAKLFKVLQNYNRDRKTGPLSAHIYAVMKTGKGNTVQHSVTPILTHRFEEDYDMAVPTEAQLHKLGTYGPDILQIPKRSELEEIAAELADDYDS